MSEQVVIDREAPLWAQRLQTDINALNARMANKVTALGTASSGLIGDLQTALDAVETDVADLQTDVTALQVSGSVLNTAMVVNAAHTTFTTVIPLDDTIPQVTEGTQILSQSIACAIGNTIEALAHVPFGNAASSYGVAALFLDGAANAIAASHTVIPSAGQLSQLTVIDRFVATATSHTVTVRCGPGSATTMAINGSTGSRFFGGVQQATLKLSQIKA
jgi:hypothetical protein